MLIRALVPLLYKNVCLVFIYAKDRTIKKAAKIVLY